MRRRKKSRRTGDKSSAQRQHAKKRASQRYKLDINKVLYAKLVSNIKARTDAHLIERQSHRVTTYMIKVWESWYPVAYDKMRGEIVTFLPQAYLEGVDLTNFEKKKDNPTPEPVQPLKPRSEPESRTPDLRIRTADAGKVIKFLGPDSKKKKHVVGYLAVVDRGDHEPLFYSSFEGPKKCVSFNLDELHPVEVADMEELIEASWNIIYSLKKGEQIVICYSAERNKRAAAIAYVFWCMLNGEGQEDASLDMVLSENSKANPDREMIRMADQLLDRKGFMLAQVL